jgi:hypothetical protein
MQIRRLWFEADPVANGVKKPLLAAEVAFVETDTEPERSRSCSSSLSPGAKAKLRFKGDRAGLTSPRSKARQKPWSQEAIWMQVIE